jgi:acyl-CoA synthetase (AMP-forming)/AMP-acid ligase II
LSPPPSLSTSSPATPPTSEPTVAGFASVYQAFFFAAMHHAAADFLQVLPQTAQAYGIAVRTWHYGEALAVVEALCARYRRAGYGAGHRVGLMLENRPAFFFHWFALNALGASVVPLGTELRAAELEYRVAHSEMVLAVVLKDRRTDLLSAARRVGVPLVVAVPAAEETDFLEAIEAPSKPALKSLPGIGTAEPSQAGLPAVQPAWGLSAECALLYTSGTTGQPKGCVLTNEYFLLSGERYRQLGGLATLVPGDRLITPLPLTHMNAMAVSSFAMILTGGCIIQLDRFHPRSWWASVRDSKATIVHYLGVMPAMLMGDRAAASDRDHCVRFGFGAGVDRTLHAAFEARFGFPLVEAWAMTETGNGSVIIAHTEPRHVGTHCFGRPGDWVEVRLIDDQGEPVPAGVPGELLVRARGSDPRRGFFREYLKDPEATSEAWAGGWFHTGDLVREGEDGSLHFVDRKKNVIRRSGENIAAVEVESVLLRHPQVAAVAVAATPDPVRGDEVLACVVPKDWTQVEDAQARLALAESIVALSLDQLAYYKAPGWVAFVSQLPLTATQKIQRGALKSFVLSLALGQPRGDGPAGEPSALCVDTRALKKRPGPREGA